MTRYWLLAVPLSFWLAAPLAAAPKPVTSLGFDRSTTPYAGKPITLSLAAADGTTGTLELRIDFTSGALTLAPYVQPPLARCPQCRGSTDAAGFDRLPNGYYAPASAVSRCAHCERTGWVRAPAKSSPHPAQPKPRK